MENKEKELIKNFESLSKFIEENDIPALILIKTNEDHYYLQNNHIMMTI